MAKGDADDPSTWTVSSTAWADDWQGFSSDNSGNNTWAVVDLGSATAGLDKMYLWNVQETNALNRGTSTFDIYYASSPSEAAPAASGTVTSYDFGSGGWTQLSAGNNLAQGTQVGDAVRALISRALLVLSISDFTSPQTTAVSALVLVRLRSQQAMFQSQVHLDFSFLEASLDFVAVANWPLGERAQ